MNRYRKNRFHALLALLGAGLFVVAFIAIASFVFLHPHIGQLAGAGGMGVFLLSGVALSDEAFQEKVVGGLTDLTKGQGEHKRAIDKVTGDLDRADKEVKQALEELTKVKNTVNDQAALMRAMEKAQKAVALNARSSFRSPIEKALANEEFRAWLNAIGKVIAKSADPAYAKIVADGNAAFKSLTGVDASIGQATVPTVTFNEIFDTLLEYGTYSTLGVTRVGARTNVLPVATSRPQYYIIGSGTGGVGETSAITPGNLAGSSVTLSIQTLAVYMTVSRELLADSTVDLAPYVLREMTQAVVQGLDTIAFIGTGNADQVSAGYIGIFNVGSANSNASVTTAQGNTTVAGTQLDDWQAVLNAVSPIVLQRNAKWWLHPQMIAKSILVRDKNGRPLFQTWMERPDIKAIGGILGYPVVSTPIAPSTDGPGQQVAAFGDGEGQAVGIREDLELATSDDINFAQNMRAYRALMRTGVKLKTLPNSTQLVPLVSLTLASS